MSWTTCCQGSNLRAWITIIVLIQCALILIYWDATKSTPNANTKSASLKLQAEASNDHLRKQGGHGIPNGYLHKLRHQSIEMQASNGTKEIYGRGLGDKHGDAKEGMLFHKQEPENESKKEETSGKLISPETEPLMYKHTRKYLTNDIDQNLENGKIEKLQKVLSKIKSVETDDKKWNLTSDKVVQKNIDLRHDIRNISNVDNSTLQKDALEQQGNNSNNYKSTVQNVSLSLLKKDISLNHSNIEKKARNVLSDKETVIHWTSTPKFYVNTKPPFIFAVPVSKLEKLNDMYSSSSQLLLKNDFAHVQNKPQVTHGVGLHKLVSNSMNTYKPMQDDPYSFNKTKLLYQIGTKDEFFKAAPLLPNVFHLQKGENIFMTYFSKAGGEGCFKEGTAIQTKPKKYKYIHNSGCLCRRGWHGRQCSIPESVFSSSGSRFVESLKPRKIARRVISALAFNVEFELLEARLHELKDVVDVLIILESNYTNFGDPKPLYLLQKLREGYLEEFHHKIIYLFRGEIPQGGKEDGWLVDKHMRTFIGKEGISHIVNTAPDDIFLYTDADEIPNRQSILFLRMHDGFSEPFGVSLRWSVFGFFWKQIEPTRVVIGCTVGMFRYVYNNSAYHLRSADYQNQATAELRAYMAAGGHIYEWTMGDNGILTGWHCSWCLPPARIRIKLTSAINADFPRWGDYPEKLKLNYIRKLVKTGTWFDDKMRFGMLENAETEVGFAPMYFLNNSQTYNYLMDLNEA